MRNYNDYDEVLALINHCALCIRNGGNKEDILLGILKAFSADQAVFLSTNSRGVDLSHSFAICPDKSFLNQYANHFWRYDPLYDKQFYADQNNLVFKTDDVIPYTQMVKLDYYNSFLRPQKLLGELIIRLYSNDNFMGVICLQRLSNHRYFDSKDTRKATLIVPYLVNIFEIADKLVRLNEELGLLEAWMESYSEGIILLDAEFKPLYINSKARSFCSRVTCRNEKTPVNLGDTLMDIVTKDCNDLIRRQNANISTKSHINRIINTENQKKYFAQYFLVSPHAQGENSSRFIIFINEIIMNGAIWEDNLISEHNLSKRQEDIAQYAAMGLTNKQIADKLNISPYTVQNHLKNIFEKTGLDSRTKLANLIRLTNSPPF